MTTASPLTWPAGWPRTPPPQRKRSAFKTSLVQARHALINELRLWPAESMVISTNRPARGRPSEPDDPGVAVWFNWRGRQRCVACDRYDRVKDNLTACLRTIEATRALSRWGAVSMAQSARIFDALPPPGGERAWHEVLGVAPNASPAEIKAAWHVAAKKAHPDRGGDHAAMARINAARDQGLALRR